MPFIPQIYQKPNQYIDLLLTPKHFKAPPTAQTKTAPPLGVII